jgi:hypothetical protein
MSEKACIIQRNEKKETKEERRNTGKCTGHLLKKRHYCFKLLYPFII